MKGEKPKKKTPKPLTKGQLNAMIDALVHRHFRKDKGLVFVNGILHGLVEQDPISSVEKFIRYNVPELMKGQKSPSGMPRGRKRSYNCTLPVDYRLVCGHKKAGPWCLKAGVSKGKCPRLVISYKRGRT